MSRMLELREHSGVAIFFFFFQAEDGIRDYKVTGVQTCALPIYIKDKAGLAGKVVGAQDGSSAVDAIKKDAAVAASFKDLKTFGDNITALMDLSAGRLDAVVVDEVVGRFHVAKKAGEYLVLEDNFGTEDYGVGLRKEDTEVLGKLEAALAEMKKDGKAAETASKWFGKDIIK